MTGKILVVEDNEKYRAAARDVLESRGLSAGYAGEFSQALHALSFNGVRGALIDCFFPFSAESRDTSLGMHAVHMMREACPFKDTPVSASLKQVGDVLGRDFARLAAKNAGVRYGQAVDPYWNLQEAIREDPSQQPLGIVVATLAENQGVPFVLVTSGYHHDELTQPIQNYCSHRGWTLLDCAQNRSEDKASPEFWRRALSELERKMGGIR